MGFTAMMLLPQGIPMFPRYFMFVPWGALRPPKPLVVNWLLAGREVHWISDGKGCPCGSRAWLISDSPGTAVAGSSCGRLGSVGKMPGAGSAGVGTGTGCLSISTSLSGDSSDASLAGASRDGAVTSRATLTVALPKPGMELVIFVVVWIGEIVFAGSATRGCSLISSPAVTAAMLCTGAEGVIVVLEGASVTMSMMVFVLWIVVVASELDN